MLIRRSVLVAAAVVAAVMLTMSAAGAAVRPFNPPQNVVGGCEASFADSVVTTGGSLRGFATCPSTGSIRFFSRTAAGVVNPSEGTGFSGDVLGVAYDTTATYVLFATGNEIRVGKRTNAGAFSFRTVDTFSGVAFPFGDIIAKDGTWFGVWSKQVGPGGEFAQVRLFSGGSTTPVGQVTLPPADSDDSEPTLAYSASTPVLIWTRIHSPNEPGPSDLMVAKYLSGAWEAPRLFASAGVNNFSPDMKIAAGRTFVTWDRDGRTIVASNQTGSFTTHLFATPGGGPKVGASVTGSSVDHVFVVATVFGSPNHVFFAETASTGSVTGTWESTTLGPPANVAVGVGGFSTKAIVTYSGSGAMFARAQS